MSILTGFSEKKSIETAVEEIKAQISMPNTKTIVYFASSSYNPNQIALAMNDAFPGAAVFGCTTSGELISGKMSKGAIVAMGFDGESISDVNIQVIPNITQENNVSQAFSAFEDYYKTSAIELDPMKYVGIIMCDGLTLSEEKIMDSIGNITNVTFIGGSAGDDLKFKGTYVFANGRAYSNAAVVALLKPISKFEFIKTQSFFSTEKRLVATKVDEENRIVIEFNHKPAAEAYAEAINQPVADVEKYFMRHPLGLMVDEEPYVRSPQRVKDGSIIFYCNVKEGMEMAVLDSTDIIADTAAALREKQHQLGKFKAIINFNCILRTLQLESQGRTKEYGEIFTDVPMIGFSTYGEAYIGHINQTATMLVFA